VRLRKSRLRVRGIRSTCRKWLAVERLAANALN
jgi:hypothetical protein